MPTITSVRRIAIAVFAAAVAIPLGAQAPAAGYHNAARFSATLDSIARSKPGVVTVSTIATSPGGRPVQLVKIGTADDKPAILVLAGAHGPQLASSEVALRLIRELAARSGTATGLGAAQTVYVVPRINPDASEAFFAPVRSERRGNDDKDDDDRDGAVNEDAPDDLNGDGLITMMRVKVDAGGEWMVDPVDPSLMRRADATKGERGTHRLMIEGKDDDGDDAFNEDGLGGTDAAINFAHNYTFFVPGAGQHAFSANETRAIAELVVARTNIAAVYVLGMQDNLVKPWEGRVVPGIGGNPQGTSAGGPLTSSVPGDNPWFAEISKRAPRPVTGQDPASASEAGDPLSWAYYHMGRFAFGSRVWWPGKAAADTAAGRRAPTPDPIAAERNDYRWLKANNPAGFVEWTAVANYTVDGRPVEVGGFAPGATLNPSNAATLDSLGAKQADWVVALAKLLPSVTTTGPAKVDAVGPRTWRISVEVVNNGFLPSNAAIGVRSRLPMRAKVELKLGNGQSLASGRKVQYIDALRGSGAVQRFEWVVVGDAGATVSLTVGAPNTGSAAETITLRAR